MALREGKRCPGECVCFRPLLLPTSSITRVSVLASGPRGGIPMENGEVENFTYLQTAMTSYNVLFWDLAMRCLFQWRSFAPDEIPPASSECLHTIVAFCLPLGGGGGRCSYFCRGAKAPEFVSLVISEPSL